jgi:CheY-like chemotaxis protein
MKKVHVLVAEDDDDHRYLTMRALRRFPDAELEVVGVRDGAETLDFIHGRAPYADRTRPDLVVLDLKMPNFDGFGVLAQLKGDPETAAIPVVVLSSSDARDDVRSAYDLGGNAYMTKPTSADGYSAYLTGLATYWATQAELPAS